MAIINHLATKFILDTPISTQQFQRACRLQYFFYLHSLNRSLQNLSHKIFSIQEVMLVIRSILVHWKRSESIYIDTGRLLHNPFLMSPTNCRTCMVVIAMQHWYLYKSIMQDTIFRTLPTKMIKLETTQILTYNTKHAKHNHNLS